MKHLSENNIAPIITASDCVLLYHAHGCGACEAILPQFEALSYNYNTQFFSLPISEGNLPFYKQFADKVEETEFILAEDGSPELDEDGVPKTQVKLDESGKPVMTHEIVVPKILIFKNGTHLGQFTPHADNIMAGLDQAMELISNG